MARGERYQPEQAVNLLRQVEVAVAKGGRRRRAARKRRSWSRRISAGVEYGVLQVVQAKDMATRPIDWQAPIKKLVTTISH